MVPRASNLPHAHWSEYKTMEKRESLSGQLFLDHHF